MVHIFLFHRDLRLTDNTTLIHQLKTINEPVLLIFIMTPEQIDKKKNKYFSDNSVQFMCESLHELSDEIKKNNGKLLFFRGDNLKVLNSINKILPIHSVGFNIDYTPYAVKRDQEIKLWCDKNNIICFMKEDYALFDLLSGQTNKTDNTPYLVYTPFMKHTSGLTVRAVDKFKKWDFHKGNELNNNKYIINESMINTYYIPNPLINVNGGRSNTLKILRGLKKFKNYSKERDFLTYKTTFLGPSLHFTTCSIREVYHKMVQILGKSSGLIRELLFREFYINIIHNFPYVLGGQIGSINESYKKEYDNISWSYDKKLFDLWCMGRTGFPIIDAAMRQLNTCGYMHNRCRMVTSSFLTKDLHIDWKWGEQYFASHLVDYDPINNNMGWQWLTGNGTDAQPWFRIFNPWTQQKTWDLDCQYIKKWIPELMDVCPDDIHNWFKSDVRAKYNTYITPIIEHDLMRQQTITMFKKALK